MRKKSKQPLQAEIKHELISTAAKKIFLQYGYKATSMDLVAQEAGVSKRTVYDHFGDKKTLFETILKAHWDKLLPDKYSLFDDNKTVADNLKDFAHIFLKFLYKPDTIDLFRLLISETPQFPDLADNILREEKAPYTQALVVYLQSKKMTGELAIENTHRSAAYFMGLLKEYHFWPMMMGLTKKKKLVDKNKLIDEVVILFLKGYK